MSRPSAAANIGKVVPKLVLVIVADQLRADHTGFGGLGFGHTPHLDSIAERGTVFERVHATNPSCMPSRASLATGRWPSVHGTRTNGIPLDPLAETVMTSLAAAGWTCAAVGKLHLQTLGWPFEPYQIDEIAATNPWSNDARPDAAGNDLEVGLEWENIARHRAELVPLPADYYGFSSVDLVAGHGDGPSGHYWHWLREHGVDPTALAGYANSPNPSVLWDEVWETAMPVELSTSSYVADRAAAQIARAAERDGSTFLFASFPDPHHPFCPPAGYATMIDPADVELPASFFQDPENVAPHVRLMLERRGTPNPDATFTFAITEAQYREAMVAQLGLIKMIDDGVGRMLAAIEAAALTDETVIIFTADHGDHFGDHGLVLKQLVHYEAVTRVPLVVAGAGVVAQRSNALVSNADVAPTILDITGVDLFRGIQGRSLRPVLAGSASVHRDAILVEEDMPIGVEGLPAPVRMRTLITDGGRLTLYHGHGFGELYDLGSDPTEQHNCYGDTAACTLQSSLQDMLMHEVIDLADVGRRVIDGA